MDLTFAIPYATSSRVCGRRPWRRCGWITGTPRDDLTTVAPEVLSALPTAACRRCRHHRGLHGAALYDTGCTELVVREDIGRHNAVDQGYWLAPRAVESRLSGTVLLGQRASLLRADPEGGGGRHPILAAVSAPSSLARIWPRRSD